MKPKSDQPAGKKSQPTAVEKVLGGSVGKETDDQNPVGESKSVAPVEVPAEPVADVVAKKSEDKRSRSQKVDKPM